MYQLKYTFSKSNFLSQQYLPRFLASCLTDKLENSNLCLLVALCIYRKLVTLYILDHRVEDPYHDQVYFYFRENMWGLFDNHIVMRAKATHEVY